MNRHCTEPLGYRAQTVDEQFLRNLDIVGIRDLMLDSFTSNIDRIVGTASGEVVTLGIGKYSYITFVPLKVSREGGEENVVLTILRGERK